MYPKFQKIPHQKKAGLKGKIEAKKKNTKEKGKKKEKK